LTLGVVGNLEEEAARDRVPSVLGGRHDSDPLELCKAPVDVWRRGGELLDQLRRRRRAVAPKPIGRTQRERIRKRPKLPGLCQHEVADGVHLRHFPPPGVGGGLILGKRPIRDVAGRVAV
jgi:hypothetical protein